MLTRRDFVAELAATTAALAAAAFAPLVPPKLPATSMPEARHPVVSIHMDQPYLDLTGKALPYLPPDGLRAGAAIAHLSDADFRSRYMYL